MKTHRVRPGLESGMYLVVVALGAALFVSLAALIVGVGFRSTGQSRLQYVTNLAVLSALEGLTESESTTYVQKANDAVQKANDVIRENPIPGLEGDLGTLTLSGSTVQPGAGVITFGKWFR